MILKKTLRVLVFFVATIIVFTCEDDHEIAERFHPSLDTHEVTDISEAGATLNAEVLQVGTSAIAEYGFVYGETNPEIERSDRVVVEGPIKQGTYSAFINRNLVNNRTYYVRAYARAADHSFTVYGQQVKFLSRGGSAPQIADFSPKTGVIGDTVLITGSGFSDVAIRDIIKFSTETAVALKVSEDSLWCLVPKNTPLGDNEISVTVGQHTVKASEKFQLQTMTLVSFSPDTVTFGDTVLISGTNFPRPSDISSVFLLGHQAVYLSATRTSIQAIVSNDVNVHESPVSVKAGVQDISSSENIILHKPVVNGFSPSKGTLATQITITGDYFSPVPSKNKVEINGAATVPVQAKRNELTVKVPGGIEPGKYPLSLTVVNQLVVTTDLFEIVSPSITAITPLNGTWGSTITIVGENFGSGISDNIVTFGTAQATVISASDTELKVQVPEDLLTKSCLISVKAVTTDNQSVTFGSPFLLDPPVISDFSPEEGKGNSIVTVRGSNFHPVASRQVVTFGDIAAEVISASSDQLTVQLPASLIDSEVLIKVEAAEQQALSSRPFHMISPWKRVADYPDEPVSSAGAFSVGQYGYVTIGAYARSLFGPRKCWRYDPVLNEWKEIASFKFEHSGTRTSYTGTVAFSIDGYGYAGLGQAGGNYPYTTMSKYDPVADAWTDITPISNSFGEGLVGAVAYSINGKGYLTSGRKYNSADSAMREYDPTTNTWKRKAEYPGVVRRNASGFSIGSRAYLTCGTSLRDFYYDVWEPSNELWEYNVETDTWKQLRSLPASGRERAAAFSISGVGYLVGGSNSEQSFADVWAYDQDSNNWTRLADFPGGPRYGATAFVIGNKAYFGTGTLQSTSTSATLNDFWEFDPSKL